MEFLIIVLIIGVVALAVMYLKKILHITEEEDKLSSKDDYLERRVKKDEEDK